jgi:hypothetical protein
MPPKKSLDKILYCDHTINVLWNVTMCSLVDSNRLYDVTFHNTVMFTVSVVSTSGKHLPNYTASNPKIM